jgi:hypothetical protein
MQVGTREDNTFNQLQNAILVEGMNLGYYVSVADDGGFQAAFGMLVQYTFGIIVSYHFQQHPVFRRAMQLWIAFAQSSSRATSLASTRIP